MTDSSRNRSGGALLPEGQPPVPVERVGILVVNLGTPERADALSVRRYLSEFLSDRRVIELPAVVWQPILQGIILNLRPRKTARAYAAIWDRLRNESPLKTMTRRQAQRLAEAMQRDHPNLLVDWAMRYGEPAIAERIQTLSDAGCRKLLLFPLYPQYSAATTASACDEAFRVLMRMRWQPALRTLPSYYAEEGYIAALAQSINETLGTCEQEPEVLLISFHGMPRETLSKGDPYPCQCQRTARLLREHLDWPENRVRVVFQSRFGPKEWLKPYADETVSALAEQGVRHLMMISPGFAADCLETLEEIDQGLRALFLSKGGKSFTYVPCLNDRPAHMDFLAALARRELGGWLDVVAEGEK